MTTNPRSHATRWAIQETPTRPGNPARQPPRARRVRAMATAVLAALAVVLPTAVALPGSAGADPSADGSAGVEVSATSGLDPTGSVVTVRGYGFDPGGHVGTRPPLAGEPSGVYVTFGRFAAPWKPSEGAPSSARQVVAQAWALPREGFEYLNPTGTNPEIVLLEPDGSFVLDLEVAEVDGSGRYGIAVYPGSGAVDPDQEVFVPLSFAAATTTTTTTTATTTTTTTATTSSTTTPTTSTTTTTAAPSSTTTSAPVTSTIVVDATTSTSVPGSDPAPGTRSATGPAGQVLEVAPADDLDPDHQSLTVTGSGYDPTVGIYVGLCVDQGDGVAPSPCVGGVDMEGDGSSSAWISSDPPDYAGDLAAPFGAGGSFEVELEVAASNEFVDCLDGETRCVVASRADHTATQDRSADVKVPVYFRGQEAPDDGGGPDGGGSGADGSPTVSLDASVVSAGGSLGVGGTGFTPGEQVQVVLMEAGEVLAVATASEDGSVRATVTIPTGTSTGLHSIELRGITSGTTVLSEPLTVMPASEPVAGVLAGTGTSTGTGSAAGVPASLAYTGQPGSPAVPVTLGLALCLLGAGLCVLRPGAARALVPARARRTRPHTTEPHQGGTRP